MDMRMEARFNLQQSLCSNTMQIGHWLLAECQVVPGPEGQS